MKYCPKCKRLYNDEQKACARPDCKGRALSVIEDESESVYLCTGDLVERDRVQAALSDSDIPSAFVRRSVSGMGIDEFDILVPFELYEKAYDIAVGIGAIELEGEKIVDEDQEYEEPEISGAKRTMVRIITAVLFVAVLALVIYGTDYITEFIKKLFT